MKNKYKRIKKAVNGLQDVAVPEQGSVSNVLSSTTSMAAAGAQFGPWGAAAGGALGLATGLIQKNAQDKANRGALDNNKFMKANRQVSGVDASIDQKTQVFKEGGNVVINGKPKYRRADGKIVKRGLWSNTYLSKKEQGTSNINKQTKVIEIEGKTTPEIHTDKNFNVKNLGTTPHTKGGNKVEASEGDIVFNTQNSLTKYNKIANAIQTGDKKTLVKEKNKLPEDSGNKNQDGNKGVKKAKTYHLNSYGDKIYDKEPVDNKPTYKTSSNTKYKPTIGGSNLGFIPNIFEKKDNKGTNSALNPTPVTANKTTTTNKTAATPSTTLSTFLNNKGTKTPVVSTPKATVISKANDKQGKYTKVVNIPATATNTFDTKYLNAKSDRGNANDLTTPTKPFEFINNNNNAPDPLKLGSKTDLTTNPSASPTSDNKSNTGANIAAFAGVANNLYQGLKSEKPIAEKYFDPVLNKYVDRSESLRQASNSATAIQNANARNVSGGSAGNLRANQQQAALGNLTRQDAINEQEMARRDAVDAANNGLKNQASQYNLQRKDMYEGQIAGGRAAKESFINQAASDIGQYGMAKQEEDYIKSRDDKANATQLAGLRASGTRDFNRDANGNQIYNPTTSEREVGGFSFPLLTGRNKARKPGLISEKGNKGVKVRSKYKMK